MLFAPAQITPMAVLPNSIKSAETSIPDCQCSPREWYLGYVLDSAPRCTPPIPPVTNSGIPTLWAMYMVPATVVPPFPSKLNTGARSLLDTLTLLKEVSEMEASTESERPIWIFPDIRAMVAGVIDLERRIDSTDWAVS